MGYELEMGVDFSENAPNVGDDDKLPTHKTQLDEEAEIEEILVIDEPSGLWMK